MGIKTSKKFDPFADRTARDIRNELSEKFVDALAVLDPHKYLNAARKLREQNLLSVHADYIDDRLQRYNHVFEEIQADRIGDPLQQALVIWNRGLFFEFHDHLEMLWQAAAGDQRQALKGLIKAAGVYIHLEQDHRQAAESLAKKSYDLIQQYASCLTFIANIETLLEKLKLADTVPPQLEISSFRD